MFGWTPGLRTLVGTRILDCGCAVGIYETWSGERVAIVDAPQEGCRDVQHVVDVVVGAGSVP